MSLNKEMWDPILNSKQLKNSADFLPTFTMYSFLLSVLDIFSAEHKFLSKFSYILKRYIAAKVLQPLYQMDK